MSRLPWIPLLVYWPPAFSNVCCGNPSRYLGLVKGMGLDGRREGSSQYPEHSPRWLRPTSASYWLWLCRSPFGVPDCPKIATGSEGVAVALPADQGRGTRSRWAGDACQFAAATATHCGGVSGPAGAQRSSRGTHPGPPLLAGLVTFVCLTGGIRSPQPVEMK